MSEEEYQRSMAVDMLTLILCFGLSLWIGWPGILLAFIIGTAINVWCSRKQGGDK